MKEERNNFASLEKQGVPASVYGGVFSSQSAESVVSFLAADCEKVTQNLDAWIIMGRDRNAGRDSGYGGRGDSAASSIDIVVGRTPYFYSPTSEEPTYADPNFFLDSARIYISQKTNLDEYFGLTGEILEEKGKSGIALKADYVRVLSRGSMRFVTLKEDKNSRGGAMNKNYGIELVAGDDHDSVQPMALGQNLSDALMAMLKITDQLSTIIDNMVNIEVTRLNTVSSHFHYSPFNGLPTTPSELEITANTTAAGSLLTQVSAAVAQLKMNIAKYQMNYLSPSGEKSILSPLNKTN